MNFKEATRFKVYFTTVNWLVLKQRSCIDMIQGYRFVVWLLAHKNIVYFLRYCALNDRLF